MNKVLTVFLAILVVSVCLVSVGCDDQQQQDFEKKTKQALWANQKTWLDIQDVIAKSYRDGKISEAQWNEFKGLDEKYRATHNSAVTAFDEYMRLKDKQSMDMVAQLITDCVAIISQANELIQAWS